MVKFRDATSKNATCKTPTLKKQVLVGLRTYGPFLVLKIRGACGVLRAQQSEPAEVCHNSVATRRGSSTQQYRQQHSPHPRRAHPGLRGHVCEQCWSTCSVLLGSVQCTQEAGRDVYLRALHNSKDACSIQPILKHNCVSLFLPSSQLPHRAAQNRQDCDKPKVVFY